MSIETNTTGARHIALESITVKRLRPRYLKHILTNHSSKQDLIINGLWKDGDGNTILSAELHPYRFRGQSREIKKLVRSFKNAEITISRVLRY